MSKYAALFKKEWSLSIAPSIFVFIYAALGLTLLAPNYPYCVAFGYCLIGIPTLFSLNKGNRDIEFTASLPISRNDVVLSKFLTVIFIQLLQIIVAIPFAIISSLLINPYGNLVGLDANLSLFGAVFIEFAVFNIIFMPLFFKTGYKLALPTTFGFVGYIISTLLIEILIGVVPVLHANLDGFNSLGLQAILLTAGIVIYILFNFFAYKMAVKNFKKVNL